MTSIDLAVSRAHADLLKLSNDFNLVEWAEKIIKRTPKEELDRRLKEIIEHRQSLLYPQPIFRDPFERWLMERLSVRNEWPKKENPQQGQLKNDSK